MTVNNDIEETGQVKLFNQGNGSTTRSSEFLGVSQELTASVARLVSHAADTLSCIEQASYQEALQQ